MKYIVNNILLILKTPLRIIKIYNDIQLYQIQFKKMIFFLLKIRKIVWRDKVKSDLDEMQVEQ